MCSLFHNIRYEEKVLVKNFPEYADYKKKVWWFGKNPFHKEYKSD